jgi:hypothetical protein
VNAYACLRHGARSPFSDARLPPPGGDGPGAWLEGGAARGCELRAARPRDLPHWLADELWLVELGGDVVELSYSVVADRVRLVRRVEKWNEATARDFCASCHESGAAAARGSNAAAAVLPNLEGAVARAEPALAAMVAATAVDLADPGAGGRERLRQARWLADRLGLDGDAA